MFLEVLMKMQLYKNVNAFKNDIIPLFHIANNCKGVAKGKVEIAELFKWIFLPLLTKPL